MFGGNSEFSSRWMSMSGTDNEGDKLKAVWELMEMKIQMRNLETKHREEIEDLTETVKKWKELSWEKEKIIRL